MANVTNCSDSDPYATRLICLCAASGAGRFFLSAWLASNLLLVPLFLSVLHAGYRRRRERPRLDVSHSDVLTFHCIGVELLIVAGSAFFSGGVFAANRLVLQTGRALFGVGYTAQLSLHSLSCVESYLAAVCPVAYLRSKKRAGVAVRNLSVGCVWFFSLFNVFLTLHGTDQLTNAVNLSLVTFALGLMCFCSVSLLCVLTRPGPGERSVSRKQLDRTKQAVFYTVVAIMAVQVTRMVNTMIYEILYMFKAMDLCLLVTFELWSIWPSSLVVPLLYLHRTRR